MNKKLSNLLFAIFIILALSFCVYMIYDATIKNKESFKIFYDSCDFFIVISNIGNNVGDLCYSPYAYLRMKEDGRTGNYCFIASNHKTIYHKKPCYQNITKDVSEVENE